MLKVIDELERMKSDGALTSVCTYLISQVYICIAAGDQYKLPSTANGHMWSSFHKMRNSSDIETVWQSLNLQEAESHLCLQLIVDRLMKLLISNRVKARQTTATPKSYTLNKREKNAVRYMAGYVAVSLLKRFKKKSKNKHVQLKRDLFVQVLRSMRAEQQPSSVSSVKEYTQVWSDLIDRGGLYHINDEVCWYMHLSLTESDSIIIGSFVCRYFS